MLRDSLIREGVTVWFDEDQILPGDSIPQKVEDGIEHSDAIILCLSPRFFDSEWTPAERAAFTYADPGSKSRAVIPVLIEDCRIPKALAHIRYVDMRRSDFLDVTPILESLTAPLKKEGRRVRPVPRGTPWGKGSPSSTHRDVSYDDLVGPPTDTWTDFDNPTVGWLRSDLAVALERCEGLVQQLIVIDLDGFTNINHAHGFEVGDHVIQEVDRAVLKWAKKELSRRATSMAITRGQDEWFVVLASTNPSKTAASRLLATIDKIDFTAIAPELYVSACGAYVTRKSREPAITLMRRVLHGLKSAKMRGPRNCIQGPLSVKDLGNDRAEEIAVGWLVSCRNPYSVRVSSGMSYATDGPVLLGRLSPWPPA